MEYLDAVGRGLALVGDALRERLRRRVQRRL